MCEASSRYSSRMLPTRNKNRSATSSPGAGTTSGLDIEGKRIRGLRLCWGNADRVGQCSGHCTVQKVRGNTIAAARTSMSMLSHWATGGVWSIPTGSSAY